MGSDDEGLVTLSELAVRPGRTLDDVDLPRAAVVIATLEARELLDECLAALKRSRYPREKLRIVVVDNGSRDGSAESIARDHGDVELLRNASNLGFAVASNQGARHAGEWPEVLVFLNNDVRVEPDWLRELVAPVRRGECQATSSKLLAWDGRTVDFAGGGANFQGIAVCFGFGDEPRGVHEIPRRCLFACGGATAVDAAVFHAVGGFDDDYFAYLEDLDLGWRLWVQGHEVHYAPRAVCHHRHADTARRFPAEAVRCVQTRNGLLSSFKNYSQASLERVFPALLATAMRRMWVMARSPDVRRFRFEAAHPRARDRREDVAREPFALDALAAADFVGFNDLFGRWDHWEAKRERVQRARRRTDAEIFRLFLRPLWCVEGEREYEELQRGVIRRFGLDELFRGCTLEGLEPRT